MTIYELASKAGVSTATVSRVINGLPGVGQKTRSRIELLIRETGYTPNLIARDLSRKKSLTAGLVLPGINSYFSPAVQSISQTLGAAGVHLLITTNPGGVFNAAQEAENLQLLLAKRVQGVILFLSRITDHHLKVLEHWPEEVELVLVNEDYPGRRFNLVLQDPEPGYAALFDHLARCGRSQLSFIGGPQRDRTAQDRLEVIRRLGGARGMELPEDRIVPGSFDLEGGEAGVQLLLDRGPVETILCANDFTAIGAIRALRSRGIQVPEQVGVVGYDNLEISRFSVPALTTIGQDIGGLGAEAAGLLLGRWENPGSSSKKILLSSELLVRESC